MPAEPQPPPPLADTQTHAKIEAIRASIAAQRTGPNGTGPAPGMRAPAAYGTVPQHGSTSAAVPRAPFNQVSTPAQQPALRQQPSQTASGPSAGPVNAPMNVGAVDLFSILQNAGVQPAVSKDGGSGADGMKQGACSIKQEAGIIKQEAGSHGLLRVGAGSAATSAGQAVVTEEPKHEEGAAARNGPDIAPQLLGLLSKFGGV
jgi:hypothetical protein